MKKVYLILILLTSLNLMAQNKKNYFIHFTSNPMVNPSAAIMSINAASEALKNASLPADQVRSVAVINMDATLLPNFLVQGKLEDKQEEYQNTLYVMDYQKVLVNEWGLGDHNNDVVIFDKQGKVLFSVDGQLNQSQIQEMLAAVKSGFD